ncbi:hypothetical protein K438DRAFT_1787394 [Mycena galopus ATCC 62051]|nr:hypothetical protein K438DRAFT_1787392 [Mycena galopus ATCC 62051]KAF8134040.1 hypothetical protein K438DRAFT_1787394 [Mycena galopus ATCC 62051]
MEGVAFARRGRLTLRKGIESPSSLSWPSGIVVPRKNEIPKRGICLISLNLPHFNSICFTLINYICLASHQFYLDPLSYSNFTGSTCGCGARHRGNGPGCSGLAFACARGAFVAPGGGQPRGWHARSVHEAPALKVHGGLAFNVCPRRVDPCACLMHDASALMEVAGYVIQALHSRVHSRVRCVYNVYSRARLVHEAPALMEVIGHVV